MKNLTSNGLVNNLVKVWGFWKLTLQPILTQIQTKITLKNDGDNNTALYLYSELSFLRHFQKHYYLSGSQFVRGKRLQQSPSPEGFRVHFTSRILFFPNKVLPRMALILRKVESPEAFPQLSLPLTSSDP